MKRISKKALKIAEERGYTRIAFYTDSGRYSVQTIEQVRKNKGLALPELYSGIRKREIDWSNTIRATRLY